MANIIVGSFNGEEQAIAASHRMNKLESNGDITVYEKVIVKKDAYGETSVIQSDTTEGIRTFSGMAIGSLVGLLAGPVGFMVGLVSGTFVGAITEADYFDISDDIIAKVKDRLQPGKVAVIAEVYEESPDFIDNAFGSLDATVIFRSDVDYIYDDIKDEEIEEIDEEIAAERAKIRSANATEKAKIHQEIEGLKDKRRKKIEELKEKYQSKREMRKVSRKERRKERLEKRISRHQTRITELEEKEKKLEH
jgi:uncharacterized membrane protein